jgi:hypothetical protein
MIVVILEITVEVAIKESLTTLIIFKVWDLMLSGFLQLLKTEMVDIMAIGELIYIN